MCLSEVFLSRKRQFDKVLFLKLRYEITMQPVLEFRFIFDSFIKISNPLNNQNTYKLVKPTYSARFHIGLTQINVLSLVKLRKK